MLASNQGGELLLRGGVLLAYLWYIDSGKAADGSVRGAHAVPVTLSLDTMVAAAAREGVRLPDPGPGVVQLDFPQSALVAGAELPLAYCNFLPSGG